MSLMKNNILYIIGVAFALVLMVFFSSFFRNVDFFPEENIAENFKTVPENLDGSSNTALAEIYGTCKKVRNFKTKF